MSYNQRLASACVFLLALASAVSAQTTWVVDDNAGPGVDFTTIQEALDVAGPLDLVDVQPGLYAPFTMTGATRLMGSAGATVTGLSSVDSVATGSWALIADLQLEDLSLGSSGGTIVLDEVRLTGRGTSLSVSDCADVRGKGIRIAPSTARSGSCVSLTQSRLQLEASEILAGRPRDDGDFGQIAVFATNGSFLHLTNCEVEGGDGGDGRQLLIFIPPGDGAEGVALVGDSRLRVSRSTIRGGAGGLDPDPPYSDAFHASAIYQCGGETREWESLIEAGNNPSSFAPPAPATFLDCGAVYDNSFHLPTFQLAGTPTSGATVSMDIGAYVNSSLRIIGGRVPVLKPTATTSLELLVDIGRFGSLGAVPPSGVQSVPIDVPAVWPRGTVMFLQASSTHVSGVTDFTNSGTFLVR